MSHTDGIGLLEKASLMRARFSHKDPSLDHQDWTSGIDAKDQKEILEKIGELTRGQRLDAGSSLLVVKAKKKGILLPIMVNLAAVLGVAAAVFGLYWFSQRGTVQEEGNEVVLNSAEGKLLAELKKSAAVELESKDKEIETYKQRMTQLDTEKQALASSLEERVKAKESELRNALQAELDKEKARLVAQGLSEAVIQERLKKFEAEKNAEYQKRLADFQSQAAAERATAEANYTRMRAEFETNIASLAAERQKIQDQARQKEQELRTSLEAKAQTLASQNAQALAGLEAAKAELQKLDEQRKKAQSVEDRVLGLYGSVRQALNEGRWGDAAVQSASLRTFLDDPNVLAIPALASRREADLFASESLTALAKIRLDQASSDSSRLLKQAQNAQQAMDAVAAARKAALAGDSPTVAARYKEALAALPEVQEAHDWFAARAAAEEAARRQSMTDSIALATTAIEAGDLALARQRFLGALGYLPLTESERAAFLTRIEDSAAQAAKKAERTSATRATRDLLSQARTAQSQGKWQDAFASWLAVLSGFPASDGAPEAAKGAETAMRGMARDASEAADTAARNAEALSARIAALQASLDSATKTGAADLVAARAEAAAALKSATDEAARARAASELAVADREARIAELNATLADRDATIGKDNARISELETLLAAAQSSAQNSAVSAARGSAAANAAAKDLVALKAENAKLAEAAAKYDAILSVYSGYAAAENAILGVAATGGPIPSATLVDAHAELDKFLSDPRVRAVAPDLRERIARYERAFQEAGQREVLYNAADILQGALGPGDAARRKAWLDEMSKRYAGDGAMSDFIAEVVQYVK